MMMSFEIHNGDCLEVMATMEANSVDAIVSDPPYGLSFMGKGWDHAVPGVEFWTEALRVAKPGAHLLAFGGTRLYHRLTCAIEDAGWEVRDCLMWLHAQGFPKVGYIRDVSGRAMKPWAGSLKPAWEPIIMARKPLSGTVAANVTEWGTGAVNVDGCRVGTETVGWGGAGGETGTWNSETCGLRKPGVARPACGRWPANLIHDGSEGTTAGMGECSRYFYCAKASKADRDGGMAGVAGVAGVGCYGDFADKTRPTHKNTHPTVKPTDLMRYLCRLVTPPGGTVLDPFTGSGSTGKAATLESLNFIGIELDPNYCDIARRRIEHAQNEAGATLFA